VVIFEKNFKDIAATKV